MQHVVAAAAADVRSFRGTAGLWLVAGSVHIAGLAAFYYVAHQHAAFSSLSAWLGTAGPRYLVFSFGIPVIFVAMLGVVLLLVDASHRDKRDQVADALDSRPVSNVALLTGRCLAVCGIAGLTVISGLTVIQAWGWLGRHLGWVLGEPAQLESVTVFVLVDCLPALVVWCSFVCLLDAAFRNRLATALSGLAVLCLHHWALFNTPIHLLPLASLFPSFGNPVSDILAEFPDGQDLALRAPWLLLAAGLLVVAAAVYPRKDCGSWTGRRLGATGTAMTLGALGWIVGLALWTNDMALRSEWEARHRTLDKEPRARLRNVAGRIDIDPGTRLDLDVEMSLLAPSRSASRKLAFSFNPGMRVTRLAINDRPTVHRHDHGILWVDPKQAIAPGTIFKMSLEASGIPDPRFAYLDSAIVPEAETWSDSRLALLGTAGSIFEDAFVALLPGSRWLPTPGPNLEPAPGRQPVRYTVDLEVGTPANWHLAGPGKQVDIGGSVRLRPSAPVPEVALFAAPFDRFGAQVENVDLEVLVSPAHGSNVRRFARDHERIVARLQWLLREAGELGIPYPYGSLQVVEVPPQLRTFGGGWRMASLRSLPGVTLLREHGFPNARFDLPASREPDAGRLRSYFDQHGSNDLLASAASNLFAFVTSPQGDGAMAIDFVLRDLVTQLLYLRGGFSTYAFEWADASRVATLPRWLVLMAGDTLGASNPSGWWRTCEPPDAAALVDPPFDEAPDLALCLLSLRSLAASRLLRDTLGKERAGALLTELRRSGAFNATDFASSLKEGPAMLEPTIGHLLAGQALPGFIASQVELKRLSDDAQGLARYQARMHVRNDEPVPGFVRIEWGTARSGSGEFLEWHTGDPVPIPGNSSVEIGFVSSVPLLDVWLLSYLSKNRQDLRLSLRNLGAEPVTEEEFNGFRASEWRLQEEPGVVVDDLDPGFFVEEPSSSWLQSMFRTLGVGGRFEEGGTDNRLPRYRRLMGADQFVRRIDGRLGWSRQEFASAWGRYRRTIARVPAGDGAMRAVFAATIPNPGRWRLDYHLPDLTPRPRFNSQLRSPVPIGVWDGGQQGRYDMRIFADSLEMVIEFDAANAIAGWNELDTLDLEPGSVRLAVSNRSSGRTVIADAIRWTRVDDSHNAANQQAAIAQEDR